MADSDAGWLDVSAEATRKTYIATAGQTVFPVPFTFPLESSLQVTVNDVVKALSTHYTTSGAGDEAGGSVTFNDGLTAGDVVVLDLVVPYELQTHVPLSGPLDVAAINLQFSLFTMMVKQLVANLPRSIRQPTGDADDISALPAAASRASKYLFFDANGDVTVVGSVTSAVAASAFMLTLLDDIDAATARATLGISTSAAELQNWLNFH
jgi:hypothetical protein